MKLKSKEIKHKIAKAKIERRLKALNYSFDGDFDYFEYIGAKNTYIAILCSKGHRYSSTYKNFTNANKPKCLMCHNLAIRKKLTNEEAENKLKDKLKEFNYSYDGGL